MEIERQAAGAQAVVNAVSTAVAISEVFGKGGAIRRFSSRVAASSRPTLDPAAGGDPLAVLKGRIRAITEAGTM